MTSPEGQTDDGDGQAVQGGGLRQNGAAEKQAGVGGVASGSPAAAGYASMSVDAGGGQPSSAAAGATHAAATEFSLPVPPTVPMYNRKGPNLPMPPLPTATYGGV